MISNSMWSLIEYLTEHRRASLTSADHQFTGKGASSYNRGIRKHFTDGTKHNLDIYNYTPYNNLTSVQQIKYFFYV